MAGMDGGSQRPGRTVVDGTFDDIDAMAASPLAWNQEYEQIGRGRFSGQLAQVVLKQLQLGRVRWSPGVLQRGAAPTNSWVFGLPLIAQGSLHVRRRPAQPGELLVATSSDDVGFTATGRTDLMVVVIPTGLIDRWMQGRRGVDGIDPDLPPRHWAVPPAELSSRANTLSSFLDDLLGQPDFEVTPDALAWVESKISDVILDMIPSAEIIEALHNRARVARAVLQLLHDRKDSPPRVTEMCELVGARERTLYLSCVEAFGRPPAQLSMELRLNAARRALVHPAKGATITSVAAQYGFVHFGRFAAMYSQRFGELPSVTLGKSLGSAQT
ncbi:MAG: helix-turn-helix domain-containing protein [Rhizobiales bacterium]|nr:helix-turn-helix domain-containing protein [Hyphomicrobiales bacterium]